MTSSYLVITTIVILVVPKAYNNLIVVIEQHQRPNGLNRLNPSLQHHLITLDGSECNEISTGGSVLVSGIQKLLPTTSLQDKSEVNETRNIAIVADKCTAESRILKSILEKLNFSVLIVSLEPNYLKSKEVINFTPSTVQYVNRLFIFLKSLTWNKIGLITKYSYTNSNILRKCFVDVSKKEKFTISEIVSGQYVSVNKVLNKVQESGAKVLVVLTEEAPHILCAAYARGMVWPYYGWIIYGYTSPDITNFPACTGSFSYLEGTVFPTYYTYPTTKASLEDTAVGLLYKASAQATLLNTDLKTALLRLPVPGIQPNLTFYDIQNNTPAVYFLQVRNGTATRVATVLNGTVAENQWLQEEQLPRGRLPVRVNTVYPTWLAAIEVIVSGSLITLTLFLYIYYRNEPEIKATSWTISLLMLLGCYVLNFYLITITTRASSKPTEAINLCILAIWISGIGIPLPLVLAVQLVKLARVYRIFYNYSKLGRHCSNSALVIYVLLLITPNIAILLFITVQNDYRWLVVTIVHRDYAELLYVCTGDLGYYYIGMASHDILLATCVAVAAIKTRKLRQKDFRDAKKINIFLFMIITFGIFGLVLYKLSYDRDQYLAALITLHTLNCSLIGFTLGFLFLPKLYPLVLRNIRLLLQQHTKK